MKYSYLTFGVCSLSGSPHDVLKAYLLDLGKKAKDSKGKPYYEVYSGDSEPIDIRLGRRHISYQPDVVWMRRGSPFIIEIALNEDWRSIVGELTLAHLSKNCSGILVISTGWDPEYLGNLVSLVGEKLGIRWYWIDLEQEELDNIERAKSNIKSFLKKWKWIW